MPKNIIMFVTSHSQVPQPLTQEQIQPNPDDMEVTPPESDVLEITPTPDIYVCRECLCIA